MSDDDGTYRWYITFTDHLNLWSQDPLNVLPGSDGFTAVSDVMSVSMDASGGLYPVRYTLWETGIYELSVWSGSTLVSGSSYTLEVGNGSVQASSSSAYGEGLKRAVAGEQVSFEVVIRDKRQSEVQSIIASGTVIEFVNEVQRLSVLANSGESFRIDFRGQTSEEIVVGVSTIDDLETILEELVTIGEVSVTSDGASSIIQNGDVLEIEFLTEHGSLSLMTSTSSNIIISKVVEGEAPFRAERQSFSCNADGGYVILSFDDRTATIEYSDDFDTFKSKVSALLGSDVSIVVPDNTIETVCTSSGQQIFVDFLVELGDVDPISVNYDGLENGSMLIFGNGEEVHGAVNGVSPIMGYFTISHNGHSTEPLAIEASANDIKVALESLPSIGSVYVTKDMVGLRLDTDGQNVVPGMTSVFGVWSVTFADERLPGCQPGSWDKCPPNIGDVSPLTVGTSQLYNEVGATQQQPAPTIEVIEVREGSSGNIYNVDDGELPDIQFSLTHDLIPEVGIGMGEVHSISCSYKTKALEDNDSTGSFELSILDKRILVNADTSMPDLKRMIRDSLGLDYLVSTHGSTHSTVCVFNPTSPVTAVTRISFAKETGPLPPFDIISEQSVSISVINLVDAVDNIEYLGNGKYSLSYTPTISGTYSASLTIDGEYLQTDLSSGVIVHPSIASARHNTHNSNLVTVAGKEAFFHVISRDRFGNRLHSNTSSHETSLIVGLVGRPSSCSGQQDGDVTRSRPHVMVEELEIGSPDGHYRVSYTPSMAGSYQTSIMLRSQGGLLATYFRNHDFSNPVYGNDNHERFPYHETPWCEDGDNRCDSTLVDTEISFEWGFDSPLQTDPSFPMDSFSIVWEGEINVKESDDYSFIVRLDGGVRLTIGESVLLDSLPEANSNYLLAEPIFLSKDEFYPVKIEYAHSTDEALIQLLWKSSGLGEEQIVPSSVLYYSQHIGGLSPSPFEVQVVPGDVDTTSTADGDGLVHCVALEECMFTIQSKDLDQNNRYNDGSSAGFEVSIIGEGGWAGEGRINSIAPTSASAVNISTISMQNNDWEFIANVAATHLSSRITPDTNVVDKLSRGDDVIIDGMTYTVSSTGTFDSESIPLSSTYLGATTSPLELLPMYKTSKSCTTGTHTVKYTPSVRGTYLIDVTLPPIPEIQRITTSVSPTSSLSGFFSVSFSPYGTFTSHSTNIAFDATAEDFKTALESIGGIGTLEVSRHDCDNPSTTCTWDVTFASFVGEADLLVPDFSQLLVR